MKTNCKAAMLGVLFVAVCVAMSPGQVRAQMSLAHPARAQTGGAVIFNVNQQVPEVMLSESNTVKNYKHYHVRKPLDGYVWVHDGDSYVLLVSKSSRIVKWSEYRPNISPES